jgi:hypothetical protein
LFPLESDFFFDEEKYLLFSGAKVRWFLEVEFAFSAKKYAISAIFSFFIMLVNMQNLPSVPLPSLM